MKEIEQKAEQYSRKRDDLEKVVTAMQQELNAVKRRHIRNIRCAVREAADAKNVLYEAISDSRGLFKKPKTKIFHGIKVGYAKRKGKVEIENEPAVVERIRKQLPEDQAELLIRVTEKVDKNAVGELTAADLKRLGIRIKSDTDAAVIAPVDGEVDKLVNALLADIEGVENEADQNDKEDAA
ncbi:MAG: hypothetical protein SV201_04840 [Pseudomonadota bacterium]|nr:hypothetical protein [Pseudomonadota bacterium]